MIESGELWNRVDFFSWRWFSLRLICRIREKRAMSIILANTSPIWLSLFSLNNVLQNSDIDSFYQADPWCLAEICQSIVPFFIRPYLKKMSVKSILPSLMKTIAKRNAADNKNNDTIVSTTLHGTEFPLCFMTKLVSLWETNKMRGILYLWKLSLFPFIYENSHDYPKSFCDFILSLDQ